MKAIQLSQFGGPEVLEYVDVPDPEPGPGQALVDMKAIGVNFRDVTMRANRFPAALMGRPAPALPDVPGAEGAGVVSEVGEGVMEVEVGDLVAFYFPEGAAYAEKAAVPSWRLVKLPKGVESVALSHGADHDLLVSAIKIPKGAAVSEDEGEGEEAAEDAGEE